MGTKGFVAWMDYASSCFGEIRKITYEACDCKLLPPASEGWGKVMFSVCSHLGGYPYPIMLCNITQNAMGQPGGYPARSSRGGTLPGGTLAGGYPGGGVTWPGGYPGWGYPGQGGTLAGGYPGWGVPWPGGVPSQDNIGSTCYMAGSMPLAFTQEDFLVFVVCTWY